jgi:hypothetical protein
LHNPSDSFARVQRWTRNLNLFEKDFVLVPINEKYVRGENIRLSDRAQVPFTGGCPCSAHWFLAIICYPYMLMSEAEASEAAETIEVAEEEEEPLQAEACQHGVRSPYFSKTIKPQPPNAGVVELDVEPDCSPAASPAPDSTARRLASMPHKAVHGRPAIVYGVRWGSPFAVSGWGQQ